MEKQLTEVKPWIGVHNQVFIVQTASIHPWEKKNKE